MISPIVLQRRLTEVGRVRLGEVVPTASGKTRPAKLSTFRFTSPDRSLIDQITKLYGGETRPWTPQNGGASQWETLTEASSVPVVVPPQSVTQWLEHWSGGGIALRCTGEREILTDSPCKCQLNDEIVCKPTTRLSILLREVQSIGVFRLESKGWNAAAELPGMADLLSRAGGYIEARLYLKPVRQVSGGKTKDFFVPALAVDGVTPDQLLRGGGSLADVNGELPSNAPRAIEAPPAPDCASFVERAAEARTVADVKTIWADAVAAGCIDAEMRIGVTDTTLRDVLTRLGQGLAKPQVSTGAGENMPADIPEDDQAAKVATWTAILSAMSPRTTDEVMIEFRRASQDRDPIDCTLAELTTFLTLVQTGEVAEDKPVLDPPSF